MRQVIGDLLPVALGVAISPVPIIAVILMLLAPKAKAASVAFMIGWVLGITVVITVTTFLLDPADSSDGGSSYVRRHQDRDRGAGGAALRPAVALPPGTG